MRKILSLALLISLGMGNIGTVIAAEKTPVLNAGAEEVKVDGTKPETKKKKDNFITSSFPFPSSATFSIQELQFPP